MRTRVLAIAVALLGVALPSAQRSAPAPQSVFGFEACADYKLATYEQIADYFKELAAASSGRMQLVDIGKTVEGRTEIMAIISSEQNMRKLGRFKDIARTLALARTGDTPLTDAQARALAYDGKAVVWIDFGLHSNEVAHAQAAPLMAFKAVTDQSVEMKFIRDNVIFLLVPNMNPDGTTLVANWYMRNVGTPWESRLPELWHTYAGHDDNRDWFMMNQPETRNGARQLFAEWFPEIVYNQHQAAPFPARIFVPPFDDPVNPNIPPLVILGVNTVGDAMARRLHQEGKTGAISRIGFDTWWNGGVRTVPYFHNMIGILTETGHASATPAKHDTGTFPRTFSNGVPTLEPTAYYPSPYMGGEWRLRNSCDYMVSASMAVLDIGAKRRTEWLYDIYRMGRDAMRTHAQETFIVPAEQWDPATAAKMINVLRLGGVEVERATSPFSAAGKPYAAGAYLIRGAQPFEPYARDLLTPQVYPDIRVFPGGPPKPPYDITGWTLSYQMGVRTDRVGEAVRAATEKIDVAPVPTVAAAPQARAAFALDPRANDAFIAVNRLLKAGDVVYRARSAVRVGDAEWPAGTFLVPPGDGTAARVDQAARTFGLKVGTLDEFDEVPANLLLVKAPRIGLYHAWGGNTDEGWTRWLLEQFEFPYASLHDADVRAGHLHAKYDVIVLPDATYDQMLNGLAPGSMPAEYTGGMTRDGAANLREFTGLGGTLVAMGRAAELPLASFGLPIRNVTAGRSDSDFYIPGAILKLKVDPMNPVAYGMPADSAAFFMQSPAFEIRTGGLQSVHPVAEYPARDVLMSGWALGERVIANHAAVVEATVDQGRLVLLGFPAQHRGQPHGTFKLLFNSLLLGASEKGSFSRKILSPR